MERLTVLPSIRVANNVTALSGQGMELLIDSESGTVNARFFEGHIVTSSDLITLTLTKACARLKEELTHALQEAA